MYDLQDHQQIELFAEEQAKYCSVFSNARRIQILWALSDGELSVGAISEAVGSSMQNISQHLGILKAYKLVSTRREGQTIYYRIEREILIDHCLGLLQVVKPEFASKILNK